MVGFVFRDTAKSEAAKLSSLKLQSLFDKAADRIEKMKQLHGNDFDKKINLQASLSLFRLNLHQVHSYAISIEPILI